MQRYRFSIRGLMIIIMVLAVAFAALRTPSRIWANAWFSLALGGITIAIPAAVVRRGDRRAFWIGFAVCGWVYFLFALSPIVSERTYHQLLTTTVLDVAAPYVVDNQYLLRTYMQAINPPSAPEPPTPWQVWNLPDIHNPAQTWGIGYVRLHSAVLYLRIGHAALCLVLAFAGGEVARYLSIARQPSAAPPTPPGNPVKVAPPLFSADPK